MIQDIAPHRLDNHYDTAAKPEADSRIMYFREGSVLVHADEEKKISFPRYDEVELETAPVYLFSVDGVKFFLAGERPHFKEEGKTRKAADAFAIEDDMRSWLLLNVRRVRREGYGPRLMQFIIYTGLQLANWYQNNRFCGRCGGATERSQEERALVCPHCGHIIYPRVVPAVIVGVRDGDRLLETKYVRSRGVPFYALVAGFTEIGETLEQTVEREVMEEVGLKVKNITYYKSQPWGIVDDILAGFYCDVDGDPTITLDKTELREAVWMDRQDVITQPDDASLTNEMMEVFKAGRDKTDRA